MSFLSVKHLATGLIALGLTAFVACKKSSVDESGPTPGGQGELSTGWLGSEDNSTIPNDPSFFSGTVPDRVDLTPYLPPVGDQGHTGTCVAWACGYYQRTALYALRNNLTTSQITASRQFSPKDLFWSIPSDQKNDDCNGTRFENALNKELTRGVATLQTVPFQNLEDCSSSPASSWTSEAANYKIESYRELPIDVLAMKEKLSEKRPLVFGAYVTNGFKQWNGSGVMHVSDIVDGGPTGGHAMTIVGYDDSRNAFRIVNSWGEDWGDHGFAWVGYDLMMNTQFTKYVFVAYDAQGQTPVNPSNNDEINIAVTYLQDRDNEDKSDALQRTLVYNLKNTGTESIDADEDWDFVYLYVNAYDADDYGVIVHRYISDDYGDYGDQGPYDDGLGSSSNRWINIDMEPGETFAQALFTPSSTKVSANFEMPEITGYYYLVLVADPFEALWEDNLNDNVFFLYGEDGGPIYFDDGIGEGMKGGPQPRQAVTTDPHNPASGKYPNAYRAEEIRQYIKKLHAAGKIPHGKGPGMVADKNATY